MVILGYTIWVVFRSSAVGFVLDGGSISGVCEGFRKGEC